MAGIKRRFNDKARRTRDTSRGVGKAGEEEDSNRLIIVKKPKSKVDENAEAAPKRKKLSGKQRKRLEKIIERREKKKQRGELLESLKSSQISAEQLQKLQSTSRIGFDLGRKVAKEPNGWAERKSTQWQDAADSSESDSAESEVMEETITPLTGYRNADFSSAAEVVDDSFESKEKENIVDTECVLTPKVEEKEGGSEVSEKVKRSFYVNVQRDPEIQASRLNLPIIGEEQVVMEALLENDCIILSGETGSGKTTQLPQFLYEAGYGNTESDHPGMIAITEPRRVAAVSMSKRVAGELSLPLSKVSYRIRYEGTGSDSSQIMFMTDGVLLKEVEADFTLSKYSAVIVDEAHERSVNTDILIGLLSRIVPLRRKLAEEKRVLKNGSTVYPLKLIVMSATLRVEDFVSNSRLFPSPPPALNVEARQFPVTMHFNRRTPKIDYVTEAVKKVSKIHRKLPHGGILVFVTSQREVAAICAKLRSMFPKGKIAQKTNTSDIPSDANEVDGELSSDEEEDLETLEDNGEEYSGKDLEEKGLSNLKSYNGQSSEACMPLQVLPLYSLLPSSEQMKVFAPVPEGTRLCVVSTNVAETSLTIPNIKYVVDSGKVKEKVYDESTDISSFEINWVSKASADQRAGRAGRTGPGHVYRLYSSAVYNDVFKKFSAPEIQNMPIEGLVLQMKCMNIDNVLNFPFPTNPGQSALAAAEKVLCHLGALDKDTKKITAVGRLMAKFPLAPRFSKMLVVGMKYDILDFVIVIVSALTVKDIFNLDDNSGIDGDKGVIDEDDNERLSRIKFKLLQKWASKSHHDQSDVLTMLKVVGAFEFSGGSEDFCVKNGLRFKALKEIRKLRRQLTNIVNAIQNESKATLNPKMKPPSGREEKLLCQIILSGFGDHVAKLAEENDSAKRIGLRRYQLMNSDEEAYLHPTSFCVSTNPRYVVFTEIVKTSKNYMKGCTGIASGWLSQVVPHLCHLSKPVQGVPPKYDTEGDFVSCVVTGKFGPRGWELPAEKVEYPECMEKYQWFAKLLLEGQIFTDLKAYIPSLLSSPHLLIKNFSSKRCMSLIQSLMDSKICSKEGLLKRWKADETLESKKKKLFLLDAYLQWIPKARHGDVISNWPPKQ
eukprot:Nk52_evm31s217 gene=Nk52_evmTU31s217